MYGISVFLIFAVTLGCFPAITVFAKSSSPESEWGTKYFIPVCCFVLFNVGDWLGRFSAEMIQWPKPGRFGMFFVLVLTLLRIGKCSKITITLKVCGRISEKNSQKIIMSY